MPPRCVVFMLALICAVISDFVLLHSNPSRMRGNPVAQTFQSISRIVRVVPSGGPVGGSVSIPIELGSQGDENAIGFSLMFDAAVLGNPMVALGADATGATINLNIAQAAQGRIGLALAFPANQKFPVGDRQLAVVSFSISTKATFGPTTINFGDQPVLREASDVNANALPLSFSPGAITLTKGFEADVTPRPDGDNNGTVTVTDWVQIGRFVAGLDTAATGNEFQRADCAPRSSLGDGKISIIDWTQAGRYATGLDPIVPAGGPIAPNPQSSQPLTGGIKQAQQNANHQSVDFGHGHSGSTAGSTVINARPIADSGQLVIELDGQGIENSLGFSLTFDPNQWRFVAVTIGHDAPDAALLVNDRQAERGIVGLAMALPAGQTFRSGPRQLIACSFAPISDPGLLPLMVNFADAPVRREVADARANFVNALFTSDRWNTNLLANFLNAGFRLTVIGQPANVRALSFQ